MPLRIRKTITLFPGVRLNISKTGMSLSVGRKGFTLNFSKRGVRQTTGLPGSGISHTSYLFKDDDEDKEEKESRQEERAAAETDETPKRRAGKTVRERSASPWGFFLFLFIALFFIYFGADAFGLLPPSPITNILQTLTQWARQIGL